MRLVAQLPQGMEPWPQLASKVLTNWVAWWPGQESAGFYSAYFGSLPENLWSHQHCPSFSLIPMETTWSHQKAFEGDFNFHGGQPFSQRPSYAADLPWLNLS